MQKTNKTIWYTALNSPIGPIYLAATDSGICRVVFGTRNSESLFLKELRGSYPNSKIQKSSVPFRKVNAWFSRYFSSKRSPSSKSMQPAKFGIKFDLQQGTSFQQSVWKTLLTIPFGQVRSYKWVAERIRNPKSVRAVGQANSNNPIPIMIPCHRVINADNTIGGYSGGIDIKIKLLKIEGALIKSQIPNSKQIKLGLEFKI